MLVSFGGINRAVNQPLARPIPQPNIQYSVSSKSRVISEASGKQILIIPGSLPPPLQIAPQTIKPQSSIIPRTERVSPSPPLQNQTLFHETYYRSQIRQHPISANNSFSATNNNNVRVVSPPKQTIYNQAPSQNGRVQMPFRSERSFSNADSNS
jgi:hypothetical protein